MKKKYIGKIEESAKDIKKIECYYDFSVRGNSNQFPCDEKGMGQMIDDYAVYLSPKEFLEKYGDKIHSSFDDDDFDENGNVDELRVTQEYYITFKDDTEITVSFSVPDWNFLWADNRDAEKGTMADKWLIEFDRDGWDMDIDSLMKEVASGGKKMESEEETESNLKVENEKNLEEVAKYMTKMVRWHRWDLKDLIHYFEKDNNFDYKVRVKIWEEMNAYEMEKTYDNILSLLKKIVEGNGKKLSSGGKKMAKGGKITSADEGNWFDSSRGRYIGEAVIETAESFGFKVKPEDEKNKKADGEDYEELWIEAEEYLNKLAPEGYWFGSQPETSDWGLWKTEDEEMEKGGLTPAKARMMLHDGKAHGKNITDKQRRYFGAVASGYAKKEKGGRASDVQFETAYTKVDGFYNSRDSFRQEEIFVGITEDDSLFFIDIRNRDRSRSDFAMSGDTVRATSKRDAKEQSRQSFESAIEDEGLAAFGERVGKKFRSLNSAVNYAIDTDGELHLFDNSTLTDEITVNGVDYLFQVEGGGQNEYNFDKLKVSFFDEAVLKWLKSFWKKYHLKELPSGEGIPVIKQDRKMILEFYIRYINGLDYEKGGEADIKKKTLKKGDSIQILGKRWFERTNGNTYHSVDVYVNNEFVGRDDFSYGYGDQYLETGTKILKQHYNLPKGMDEHTRIWGLEECGIKVLYNVSDVARKKDLEKGGKVESSSSDGIDWLITGNIF